VCSCGSVSCHSFCVKCLRSYELELKGPIVIKCAHMICNHVFLSSVLICFFVQRGRGAHAAFQDMMGGALVYDTTEVSGMDFLGSPTGGMMKDLYGITKILPSQTFPFSTILSLDHRPTITLFWGGRWTNRSKRSLNIIVSGRDGWSTIVEINTTAWWFPGVF